MLKGGLPLNPENVHELAPRKTLRVNGPDGKVLVYHLAEESGGGNTEMLLMATERLLTAINLLSNLTLRVDETSKNVEQAVARANASLQAQARFAQSAEKLAEALMMDVVAVTNDKGKVIGARRVPKIPPQGG